MASRADISAGKAFISLYLRGSDEVQAGLQKIAGKFKAMGAGLSAVGATMMAVGGSILGALGGLALNFSNIGDDLDKMSGRTGIAAQELSRLAFAAGQSGTSLDDVENGVRRMQQSLTDAARGSGVAKEAFDALGLSTDDLMKMTPDEQFKAIASAIAAVEDPTLKAALAMAIFGKSGTGLLPLLNEGRDGINALGDEAERLGATLTDDQAKAAAELSDAFGRVTATAKGLALQIGAALAPALTSIANAIAAASAPVVEFIRNNTWLVTTIAAVGAGIVAVGGVLMGMGVTLSLVGTAISGFAAAIGVVGSVLAAVFSPVGLLIAGVVALGVAIAAAVAWALKASGAFQGLGEMFGETWKGIVAAVKGGDLAMAFELVVAQVRVIWTQLVNSLMQLWDNFIHYIASEILSIPGADMLFGPDAGKALDDDFARRASGRDDELERLKRELADLQKEAQGSLAIELPKGASKIQYIEQTAAGIQANMADSLSPFQRGTFSGDFASRLGQGTVNRDYGKETAENTDESTKTLKDLLKEVQGLSLEYQ